MGFADLDRSTPGSRRSLTMTICGAAILRRAAYGIADIADIARDRKGKTTPPRAAVPHEHRRNRAVIGKAKTSHRRTLMTRIRNRLGWSGMR